ncbi:TPA: GTP-binding protein [Candidatus Woesearchaeota archaeon]|nr:GTP-binding protein [Candidatus Woesearchaeota archaeon]
MNGSSNDAPPAKIVSVSIVTGALGSGKTTLLNYLLTENHGIKIGVIVNEFGDVGIDSELIVASTDEMVELANGCICCTIRGDLVGAVKQVLERGIEYILIETSGMAEPGPVANTFLTGEMRLHTKLDGIITVVDAEHLHIALHHGPTTEEQIKAADVILLNKTDVVADDELDRLESEIHAMSPRVFIFRTVKCRAPLNILLATGRFNIDRWLEEGNDKEHDHEHAVGFTAVSISEQRPLRVDSFAQFTRLLPVEIFRAKGIVCVGNLSDDAPEKDLRMVFHKVGKRIETFFDRSWRPGERHETRIVLIGTDVDKERWQEALETCVR